MNPTNSDQGVLDKNHFLLSIGISTFNRADLLESCLQSLLVQTMTLENVEVLVIENNCTDHTSAVVKRFFEKFPHLRLIRETQQGLSHCRNRAWQEARAAYIAYIDDDAKADRHWVMSILDFVSRHPEAAGFGGPYVAWYNCSPPKWFPKEYGAWSLPSHERVLNLSTEFLNGTNMVFKRQVFLDHGGFLSSLGMRGAAIYYGEETELQIRIRNSKALVYYVPNVCVMHLVAPYKMNLRWLFESAYKSGASAGILFHKKRGFGGIILRLFRCFAKSIAKFIFNRDFNFKSRIYQSFNGLVYAWGECFPSKFS